LKKRRVQHYGYEFIYGKNRVDPEKKIGPLPEWLEPSLGKMNSICEEYNGEGSELEQLTINEYFPGQGIPPHVDSHQPFKEAFAVLSLCGGTVMNFKNHKGQLKHLYLPPRSLYVLTGESRYAWFHSISERRTDRVEG
jgi:alkylated DNA repair protein alkB family protein 8